MLENKMESCENTERVVKRNDVRENKYASMSNIR